MTSNLLFRSFIPGVTAGPNLTADPNVTLQTAQFGYRAVREILDPADFHPGTTVAVPGLVIRDRQQAAAGTSTEQVETSQVSVTTIYCKSIGAINIYQHTPGATTGTATTSIQPGTGRNVDRLPRRQGVDTRPKRLVVHVDRFRTGICESVRQGCTVTGAGGRGEQNASTSPNTTGFAVSSHIEGRTRTGP